jgi:hypothetical protein
MIELFIQWLDRKRAERSQRRFRDGFDYAAGALLRGSMIVGDGTIQELENSVAAFDHNEFDDGAALAMRQWRKLLGELKP